MADNVTLTRVVDLVAQDTVDASVYGLIDSETGGTKKYPLGSKLVGIDQELSDINDEAADIKKTAETAYITDTVSGAVVSFPDGSDDIPVKALSVGIEPVQASGTPAPDNVLPISGWDTVKVTRCGRNLFDGTLEVGGLAWATGAETISSTSRRSDFIPVKPNTSYYEKMLHTTGSGYVIYDADKVRVASRTSTPTAPFTTPATAAYIRVVMTSVSSDSDLRFSLVESDTETDYIEYVGQTYEIALPQTVYGGTLDVASGELVIDHALVDLGTLTWSKATGNNYRNFNAVVADLDYNSTVPYVIADCYKSVAINAGATADGDNYIYSRSASATSNTISIKDTSKADMTVAEFKTAMSGHYAVYKMSTPQTLTLTPEQVTTLLGQNNIYADSGEVSVTYRADTGLYIAKLTGSTETDMVSDDNINANTYFMVGNNLYISTAAIAAGEVISPGTNCTQVTLAEALNTLNQ